MSSSLIQHWQTKQGTQVYFVQRNEIPMLETNIVFAAGSGHDDIPGVSNLTNIMLNQGTKNYNTDQIAAGFDDIGAQFHLASDRDMGMVSLRSLTKPKYLYSALRLLTEILSAPLFPKKSFLRMQQLVLLAINRQKQTPEAIAKNAFYEAVYRNHIYGNSVLGTEQSVAALTVGDLKKFHKKYYVAKNAIITLVGDVTRKRAEQIANQLVAHLPSGEIANQFVEAMNVTKKGIKKIDFPSEQTHILMGQVGISYDDPDYFPIMVGNTILGGSSVVSRLFSEVRGVHGLAYSITSIIMPLAARGPFLIVLQTRHSEAKKTIKIVNRVLTDFIEKGPTKSEILRVKKKIINGFPLTLSQNNSVSDKLCAIGFNHLPLNYLDSYCEKVNVVTARQIKQAFQRHFNPEKKVTIMVGNS